MTALIIALPEEAQGIEGYPIYLSGCGKINATIATMKAIHDGHEFIINYGSAGTVSDVTGLVEVTGYVDRDMDAIALGFQLGQTPFENGVMIGDSGIVCGSGDKFATSKPKIECDIVDMEAYALSKVCYHYDVPFISFKYITDGADGEANNDWEENVSKGIEVFKEKVLKGLK